MKKLSQKQKQYFLRRRDLHAERRRKSKLRAKLRRLTGEPIPARLVTRDRRGNIEIKLPLPESFSLQDNYEKVMDFVNCLRKYGVQSHFRVYVDFRTLRYIGPSGALLLAAEIDRWRRIRGFKPAVRDLSQWDPVVYLLLEQMGLFDILEVTNLPKSLPIEFADISFIRFRTDQRAMGERVKELRMDLEELAGDVVPAARRLYAGLTEAITNVAHHAYPEDASYTTPPIPGRWWMSGSFEADNRHLTVIFFDQGVGIPYTVPRSHPVEKLRGLLSSLGLADDDASLIRAAMEVGRSQTGLSHRGEGLIKIKGYTDDVENGRLRILSGRGEYIYAPGEPDPKDRERRITHKTSIGGTLIQWEATLPKDGLR